METKGMLDADLFGKIREEMIKVERELISDNKITISDVYCDDGSLKSFKNNSVTNQFIQFINETANDIKLFANKFKMYAEYPETTSGEEQKLKINAKKTLQDIEAKFNKRISNLNDKDKKIAEQIRCDLMATLIDEYPTMQATSTDYKMILLGPVKKDVQMFVSKAINEFDANAKEDNAESTWFVDEMYNFLANSNHLSANAKEGIDKLKHTTKNKSKNHVLMGYNDAPWEIFSNGIPCANYIINGKEYNFIGTHQEEEFLYSRQEYLDDILGTRPITKNNKGFWMGNRNSDLSPDNIVGLNDNLYSTFVEAQSYSNKRKLAQLLKTKLDSESQQ